MVIRMGYFWAGSTGAAYRRVSGDTNPNEYVFVGSGGKRFTFDWILAVMHILTVH